MSVLLHALLVTSHPLAFDEGASNTSFTQRADIPPPILNARAAPTFYARILPLGASIVFGVGSTDKNGYGISPASLSLLSTQPCILLTVAQKLYSFRKPLRDALRQAGRKVNMVGSKANGDMRDNASLPSRIILAPVYRPGFGTSLVRALSDTSQQIDVVRIRNFDVPLFSNHGRGILGTGTNMCANYE